MLEYELLSENMEKHPRVTICSLLDNYYFNKMLYVSLNDE